MKITTTLTPARTPFALTGESLALVTLLSRPGAPGVKGSIWYAGTGAPSDLVGLAGDYYIATDTLCLYGPKTTVWGDYFACIAGTVLSDDIRDALDAANNPSGQNPFVTFEDLSSSLTLYPTTAASDVGGYFKIVTDIEDVSYDAVAVDVPTGPITGTNQLLASLATDAGVLVGDPGVFTTTTIGNIRKTGGAVSTDAFFHFEIFKRSSLGVETLIATSSETRVVSSATYLQFSTSALFNDGSFTATDRVVLKFYGTKVGGGIDPTYDFQFGGMMPVRTLLPVPVQVLTTGFVPKTVFEATKDPTGFINPTDVDVTEGVLNATLTGDLSYLWRGDTDDLGSPFTPAIPHTDGADGSKRYLKSTDNVTIAWSSTPWDYSDLQLALAIRVKGVWYYFTERHGTMPWLAHQECHNHPNIGAYRVSGGEIVAGTYAINTDGDAAVTPDFSGFVIADEDNHVTQPGLTAGEYAHLYFSGLQVLEIDTAQALPYRVGTTYPLVNGSTGGTFTDTEIVTTPVNNTKRWINVYQILTPASKGAVSQGVRMLFLQPQFAYTSLAAAQAEPLNALNLAGLGGFTPEITAYSRLTYETGSTYTATGKVRLAATATVTGKLNVAGTGTAATTAENVQTTPYSDLTATNQQETNQQLADQRLTKTAGIYTAQTGNFTIQSDMAGKDIPVTGESAIITLPTWNGAGFGNGFQCKIVNLTNTNLTYSGTVAAAGTKQPAYGSRVAEIINGTWFIGGLTT